MECQECNKDKKTRQDFQERQHCGCCGGERKITFNRYVQYNLGWVCYLNFDGTADSSVQEMNERCQRIVKECFDKFECNGKTFDKTLANVTDDNKNVIQDIQNFIADYLGISKEEIGFHDDLNYHIPVGDVVNMIKEYNEEFIRLNKL